MSEKPDNPRAFPLSVNESGHAGYEGMSLRDWFAGKVLAGEMACQGNTPLSYIQGEQQAEIVAKKCYLMADVMLRIRGQS